MHQAFLLIIVIGQFLISLTCAVAEESSEGGSTVPGMVYVEPTNILQTSVDGEYRLVPYKERRGRWGVTAGVAIHSYTPAYLEPNFRATSFEDLYGQPSTPLTEFQLSVKRNLSLMSLGVEFAIGHFEADGDPSLVASNLTINPIRLGAVVYLDTLMSYVVPYASAGGYVMRFREGLDTTSFNGNTQVAPYYSFGAAFLLDWIDRRAARTGYEQTGVEASYLFVEARQFLESSSAADQDFSSDMNFGGGLRVEF